MSTAMTFPYRVSDGDAGVLHVFRRASLSTFVAEIKRVDVGFNGLIRCRLMLSIGELSVEGNRETVPLILRPGDWVRVRALRVPRGEDAPMHVLSMRQVPADIQTSWVPTSLCHREAHQSRLRELLVGLTPSMQAAFMVAMSDAQLQRRFFWRVGAGDHHCYPGGLFDSSVVAGETAYEQDYDNHRQRSVAALAALLFDVGKAFDPLLAADARRGTSTLAPHPATAARLRWAHAAAARIEPADEAMLRAVLETNPGSAVGGPPEVAHVAQRVRAAVRHSWGLDSSPGRAFTA